MLYASFLRKYFNILNVELSDNQYTNFVVYKLYIEIFKYFKGVIHLYRCYYRLYLLYIHNNFEMKKLA